MVVKKRNWAIIVYPESAPADWIDRLQATGLQCAISPLHDKDINPTGELKKAHYHVICCYSGPTSYNVVRALCDSLNAPIPQALEQVKGYYRYLTHKDNPEKYQYNDSDITTLNGFNILDYADLTKSEINKIKLSLQLLIRHLDITDYCVLMDYLQDNDLQAEYDIASNNTYFFDRYISSRRNNRSLFDSSTGEVKSHTQKADG